MFDNLGATSQCADFTNTCDDLPIPHYPEFEILVRIEPMNVPRELRHDVPPNISNELQDRSTAHAFGASVEFLGNPARFQI